VVDSCAEGHTYRGRHVFIQSGSEEMRVKKWLPYFSVVIPWVVAGMPLGLAIPILILDIPILNVPLYHKLADVAVLLVFSLVLGVVFAAIDVKLGIVKALCKHRRS